MSISGQEPKNSPPTYEQAVESCPQKTSQSCRTVTATPAVVDSGRPESCQIAIESATCTDDSSSSHVENNLEPSTSQQHTDTGPEERYLSQLQSIERKQSCFNWCFRCHSVFMILLMVGGLFMILGILGKL